LAHNIVDTVTGELIANANDEITEELMNTLFEKGVKEIRTLFTNDLDHGPYISDTLRARGQPCANILHEP
jgi:DNA-directed RNA polymerase subunit beta